MERIDQVTLTGQGLRVETLATNPPQAICYHLDVSLLSDIEVQALFEAVSEVRCQRIAIETHKKESDHVRREMEWRTKVDTALSDLKRWCQVLADETRPMREAEKKKQSRKKK